MEHTSFTSLIILDNGMHSKLDMRNIVIVPMVGSIGLKLYNVYSCTMTQWALSPVISKCINVVVIRINVLQLLVHCTACTRSIVKLF